LWQNEGMTNAELRDDQWKKIYSFLQHHPRAYAGQEESCRLFLEAVWWILRSGAQWRLLPEKYGPWNSVYKRFARWCDHQVWEDMHQHFVAWIWRISCWIAPSYEPIHHTAAGAAKKWRAGKPASDRSRAVHTRNPRQRRCWASLRFSSDWRAPDITQPKT
jgi:transposase